MAIGKCHNCGATVRIPQDAWEKFRASADLLRRSVPRESQDFFMVEVKFLCCENPDWTWFEETSEE